MKSLHSNRDRLEKQYARAGFAWASRIDRVKVVMKADSKGWRLTAGSADGQAGMWRFDD